MKLQDKETNEIIEIEVRRVNDKNLEDETLTTIDGEEITLEKLGKKFVDYIEPIEFWTIDAFRMKTAHVYESPRFRCYSDEQIANLEELGLKFDTEEEAKQALEKLKAWKRMKNDGCVPIEWRWKQDYPDDACYVEVVLKCQFDAGFHDKDMDLLFRGGEE